MADTRLDVGVDGLSTVNLNHNLEMEMQTERSPQVRRSLA
jgi:hypothetical protein